MILCRNFISFFGKEKKKELVFLYDFEKSFSKTRHRIIIYFENSTNPLGLINKHICFGQAKGEK